MTEDDPINPKHYHGTRVIEIIEEFNLGFKLGNTVKYILRSTTKNGIEDLKKAMWYLQREIDQVTIITSETISSSNLKTGTMRIQPNVQTGTIKIGTELGAHKILIKDLKDKPNTKPDDLEHDDAWEDEDYDDVT